MSKTIIPKFDFSNPLPVEGEGQQHTVIQSPNNSLAPNKFNEYERLLVEISKAIGDYDLNDLFPNMPMTLPTYIRGVFEITKSKLSEIETITSSLDQSISSLSSKGTVDITQVKSLITTEVSDRKAADNSLDTKITNLSNTVIDNKSQISSLLTAHNTTNETRFSTIESSKFDKSGGTITGIVTFGSSIDMSGINKSFNAQGNSIKTSYIPIDDNDVCNKLFTDNRYARKDQANTMQNNMVFQSGITMSNSESHLDLGGSFVKNSGDPLSVPGNYDNYLLPKSYNDRRYATLSKDTNEFQGSLVIDQDVTIKGRLIGGFPIGTIVMFDGTSWIDDSTLPGWYSCITDNESFGCPNLVGRFIFGAASTGRGLFGGSESVVLQSGNMPAHTHNMNHGHGAHTHNIDAHKHTFSFSADGVAVPNKGISTEAQTITVSISDHTPINITPTITSTLDGKGILSDSLGADIGIPTTSNGTLSGNNVSEHSSAVSFNISSHSVTVNNSGIHTHAISKDNLTNLFSTNIAVTNKDTSSTALVSNSTSIDTSTESMTGSIGNGTAFAILPPWYKTIYIRRCK